MRKGSGVPAISNHLRIPKELHQKLIASKEKKSLNKRIMELLAKALEAEEAQKREVVSIH